MAMLSVKQRRLLPQREGVTALFSPRCGPDLPWAWKSVEIRTVFEHLRHRGIPLIGPLLDNFAILYSVHDSAMKNEHVTLGSYTCPFFD